MVTGVGNATLYQENLVKGYLTIPKKPGVRPISIPHPLGWGGRTQFDSLIAAAEAISLGEGGISIVSRATGISRDTISKGCKELEIRTSGEIGTPVPEGKIRAPGGGRKKSLDKDPTLIPILKNLLSQQAVVILSPLYAGPLKVFASWPKN